MDRRAPRIGTRQSQRIRGQPAAVVSRVGRPAQKTQCPRHLKKEAEKLLHARAIEKDMRMRIGPAMRLKQKAMLILRYVKSTNQGPQIQKKAMKKAYDAARSEQKHRKNARRATVMRKSKESSFWNSFPIKVVAACLGATLALQILAGLAKSRGIYVPLGPPNMGPYRVRFKHAGSM